MKDEAPQRRSLSLLNEDPAAYVRSPEDGTPAREQELPEMATPGSTHIHALI